ncbi:hypothetical protein EVC12_056 [Rhizobium phage RHph_I42]|nr:hypothetical protein EVC12_056 [Rhizobium phage RHph_I42]
MLDRLTKWAETNFFRARGIGKHGQNFMLAAYIVRTGHPFNVWKPNERAAMAAEIAAGKAALAGIGAQPQDVENAIERDALTER